MSALRLEHSGVIRIFAGLVLLAGCQSGPRSTRLTASDFEVVMDEMVASLAASDFLRGRGPDSPAVTIMINRVENMTSDVIPLAQQWMLVARVRDAMPMQVLSQERNVHFVITPERHADSRRVDYPGTVVAPGVAPTHVMAASFLSSRRSGTTKQDGMTNVLADYYYLEYSITEINTHRIEWSDRFEFKREVVNKTVID